MPFNPTDKYTIATIVSNDGAGKPYRLMKGAPQVTHQNHFANVASLCNVAHVYAFVSWSYFSAFSREISHYCDQQILGRALVLCFTQHQSRWVICPHEHVVCDRGAIKSIV